MAGKAKTKLVKQATDISKIKDGDKVICTKQWCDGVFPVLKVASVIDGKYVSCFDENNKHHTAFCTARDIAIDEETARQHFDVMKAKKVASLTQQLNKLVGVKFTPISLEGEQK